MAFTGTVHRPRPRRTARRRRRVSIIVIITLVLVAGAAVLTANLLNRGTHAVSASSSRTGTDLQSLVRGGSTSVTWRPAGQALGSWVEQRWDAEHKVDHVTVTGSGHRSFTNARLTFSDGSALLLTPDSHGVAEVSFPERSVHSARLTIAQERSGTTVGLASFVVTNDGTAATKSSGAVRAVASTSAPGSSAAAIVDGDLAAGELGQEWLAAPTASTARATVSWTGQRQVATVRLWGPTAPAFDPAYSAAAALNGTLEFSDGSVVRVSGIAGGAEGPTTVAFTPRMATSVTVVLQKTIAQATIGLRGVAVYDSGNTASRNTGTAATTPLQAVSSPTSTSATTCTADSAPIGTAVTGVISLVCPSVGATVDGEATVVVAAPAGSQLTAEIGSSTDTSLPFSTDVTRVAASQADQSGRATLKFSADKLPHGPLNVAVISGDGLLRTLHVQLYNAGGLRVASPSAKPADGSLVWDEEFNQSTTVSPTGAGATYGSLKPEYFGGSQFGDAVFDSPQSGAGTFSLVDKDYLRIRVQPLGDRADPAKANRKYLGGLLSSLRVGASGFSAQYGYYEIRMMAPAAYGTWPAFWMMNDDSATKVTNTSTEVDAVELYGNRTRQTCHSIHNYVGKKDTSTVHCINTAIATDWGLGWHTYGVDIQPGRALFSVDGKLVQTETGLTKSNEPFFFMANLALGGGWPVELGPVGNEADLWIDYIRVYV